MIENFLLMMSHSRIKLSKQKYIIHFREIELQKNLLSFVPSQLWAVGVRAPFSDPEARTVSAPAFLHHCCCLVLPTSSFFCLFKQTSRKVAEESLYSLLMWYLQLPLLPSCFQNPIGSHLSLYRNLQTGPPVCSHPNHLSYAATAVLQQIHSMSRFEDILWFQLTFKMTAECLSMGWDTLCSLMLSTSSQPQLLSTSSHNMFQQVWATGFSPNTLHFTSLALHFI